MASSNFRNIELKVLKKYSHLRVAFCRIRFISARPLLIVQDDHHQSSPWNVLFLKIEQRFGLVQKTESVSVPIHILLVSR